MKQTLKNDLKFYLSKLNLTAFNSLQHAMFKEYTFNHNIVLNAKTGTGKTFAYAIPLIHEVLNNKNCGGLIIVPTTALISEIKNMVQGLSLDNTSLLYTLKTHTRQEIIKCTNSKHSYILIITPLEFKKLLSWGCNFSAVKTVVYDEADMLLESDFKEETIKIGSYFQKRRQVLVSATITSNIKPFINQYFGSYKIVGSSGLFARQKHILINLKQQSLDEGLKIVCETINPFLMIIFVSKKENIPQVVNILNSLNLRHIVISGLDNLSLRQQKINQVKDHRFQYVVASDILARGLNLNCSHVVNYDLPRDLDYFTHRAGRTARVNDTGFVYTFQTADNEKIISRLRNKGVPFMLHTLKNGLIEKVEKSKKNNELLKEVLTQVKKPNKVKPNYKKKYKEQVQKKLKAAKVKAMLQQKRKAKFRGDN